jgi:predicted SAM-dependent methyltransferase
MGLLTRLLGSVPVPLASGQAFSLRALAKVNPALAEHYLWGENVVPANVDPRFVQLGCGENVLAGFVNLDFIPHDERVFAWNLLDVWPDAWNAVAQGVFAEDVLEHFFYGEQVYILANVNRMLRDGGVARILMPSLPRLVEYGANYQPAPDELLHRYFGVETAADALNMGMRFSGHRWLHSAESLAALATMCGFALEPTSCAHSSVPQLAGINLRNETDSLSFANDLRKVRPIRRTLVTPQAVSGASLVEEIFPGAQLYVATSPRPAVDYVLPSPIAVDDVACLNFRASNLSSFNEHNLKSLTIDGLNADKPWHFDETLRSRPCMNVVTRNQLRLLIGDVQQISRMSLSPAARIGEHFVLGCAETFTRDAATG